MGLFHAPFLRWCRLNVPDFPTQGTAAVMLAQSRRTRPCGIRCAAAVVMLAQSRRTRPCGCLCATAAVILELHPTAPTLLLLSTETTRTRFALWTWVGHGPASTDGHRGDENVSCHVACGTEFRCASMTVASTKVTTCETNARILHGVPAWLMNA